jgi:nitronate monooxygenase
LARSGGVDGFVVEGPVAGGHNAPPRGGAVDAQGQPVYGPRDQVDLEKLRRLGLPFWLAGGRAGAGSVAAAQAQGARGVQIGTAFAWCRESGMVADLRRRSLGEVLAESARVHTDARASPTGFPFKVVPASGTVSDPQQAARQRRPCALGYLRQAYRRADGMVAFRCPAEPEALYVAKGGEAADAAGRVCLCNGLLATAGHPHAAGPRVEPPLITAGDDLHQLGRHLGWHGVDYGAEDVIRHALAG